MTQDEVFAVVKENILFVLPDLAEDQIKIELSLTDLGANSVDRMEVVTSSMSDLKIKIPLLKFAGVENIQGLVDVLYENC